MLPTTLDAVIFDAGGTLVRLDYAFIADRVRASGASIQEDRLDRAEAIARHAIDAGARESRGLTDTDEGRRAEYFRRILGAAGVEPGAAAEIAGELDRAHAGDNLWRVPLEGAGETLRRLRARGMRTAVVSNADGRIESVLSRAGLSGHLDLIVDSHIEGVEKPDPEIFRRALDRLGVAAERAAYVGDIYSIDAVGARAAGLAPVIVDWTGTYGNLDCLVIRGLTELLDRLPPAG